MLSIQKDESMGITHWALKVDGVFNSISLNSSSLYLKWEY